MARMAVLMLCHRIPYPADKGDKIRNLNLIRALQQVADVSLGCFIDSAFDLQYQSDLEKEVTELFCLYRSPLVGALHAAAAVLSGRAITSAWYADARMQAWIRQNIGRYDRLLVSSSAMLPYLSPDKYPANTGPSHTVIDLVDVDSDKWLQYTSRASWFLRWLYRREARLISALEQQAAAQFNYVTLVSDSEVRGYLHYHQQFLADHGLAEKIISLSNGVDCEYFSPCFTTMAAQQPTDQLLFTGEMSYKPNVEAVLWFVSEVWPLILLQRPSASFVIVGRHPAPAIKALNGRHNILVTGRVADVRPWLAQATVMVAPMLLARGIKNKVLEGMAMAKPLVATPQAMLGLEQLPVSDALEIATSAADFAAACLRQLQRPERYIIAHREYVQTYFSWQRTLAPLFGMLDMAVQGNKS